MESEVLVCGVLSLIPSHLPRWCSSSVIMQKVTDSSHFIRWLLHAACVVWYPVTLSVFFCPLPPDIYHTLRLNEGGFALHGSMYEFGKTGKCWCVGGCGIRIGRIINDGGGTLLVLVIYHSLCLESNALLHSNTYKFKIKFCTWKESWHHHLSTNTPYPYIHTESSALKCHSKLVPQTTNCCLLRNFWTIKPHRRTKPSMQRHMICLDWRG